MSGEIPEVDVIVRTMAERERTAALGQALDSILDDPAIAARAIVVVNGQRRDAALVKAIAKRPGVVLLQFDEGSAGKAMVVGRRSVTAPYFTFLDDDDLFVEGGLQFLVDHMRDTPACDVLITNRYRRSSGISAIESAPIDYEDGDPLLTLFERNNWLAPGRVLFRTAAVGAEILDVGRSHHEWTHVAMRLASQPLQIDFIDRITGIYNDTPGSESKLRHHQIEELRLFDEIESDMEFADPIKRLIASKRVNILHKLAESSLAEGELLKAWRYHARSVVSPYCLRYLLFTRKMLMRTFVGKSQSA